MVPVEDGEAPPSEARLGAVHAELHDGPPLVQGGRKQNRIAGTEESCMEGGFSIMTTLDGATASETRWFLKKSVSSLAHFKPDSTRSAGTSELLKTSWVQAEYAAEGS